MFISSVSLSDAALRHFKFSSLVQLPSTDCQITTPFQCHLHLYVAIYSAVNTYEQTYCLNAIFILLRLQKCNHGENFYL